MSAEEPTLSKSARKRANQKARAAEEAAAAAEPPAPAPKAKAEPKAKAKAEAKAEPKAKAKAEPKAEPKAKAKAEPKAEPKAKAKADAKAKAKAAPEPPAPEPKSKAKAKAKAESAPAAPPAPAAEPKAKAKAEGKAKAKAASAKAKPAAKEEPKPEPKKEEVDPFIVFDDGKGGAWEVSTGLSKKQQKRKERLEEDAKELAKMQAQQKDFGKVGANQYIPGYVSPEQLLKEERAKAAKDIQKVIAEAKAAGQAVKAEALAALAGQQAGQQKEADTNTTATVKVPEAKIGRVIGPKGSNINLIKEKTGVKNIETNGDLCTIVGPEKCVALAEAAIRELMEKGYMSLAFEDFQEAGVQVHPSVFPNLIGEKGVVIQKIKAEAKVEIDIPQGIPKDAVTKPKKYKVSIAGSNAGVEKAKEIINSIAMYSHHELTHPGMTHKEMEVEEWRYRYLIGKGGSEMRHIQNNYKVKVNIPREFSAIQNVVIVGEPRDVDRAVTYIEKIMYEADQPKGRGADDKADDGWGDEEAVEDWMTPYMYKRR